MPNVLYSLWRQDLSRAKAAAITDRAQAEEEQIKIRNHARLEEVMNMEKNSLLKTLISYIT